MSSSTFIICNDWCHWNNFINVNSEKQRYIILLFLGFVSKMKVEMHVFILLQVLYPLEGGGVLFLEVHQEVKFFDWPSPWRISSKHHCEEDPQQKERSGGHSTFTLTPIHECHSLVINMYSLSCLLLSLLLLILGKVTWANISLRIGNM